MTTVYVLFGFKYPYTDPVMGEMPGRKDNLSVHDTWSGMIDARDAALYNVERYKDPAIRSLTRNWDYDQIFFDTIKLER